MKGILVTIGATIGLIIFIFGVFGDLSTSVDLLKAVQPAAQGNTTGAVEQVTQVTADYMVEAVRWALAIGVIGAILAVFGIKIRMPR